MICDTIDCENEALSDSKCLECMDTSERLGRLWREKTEELKTDELEADNG